MNSTIILASDHAGFELKETVKRFLEAKGYHINDVGAHTNEPDDDYPVYMHQVGSALAQDMAGDTLAIIFGKSGQGEAMVANRYPGVRAAVYYGGPTDIIRLSREHNDANVLSIGAGFVDEETATQAVTLWLETPFSNDEKHARRIDQIDSIA